MTASLLIGDVNDFHPVTGWAAYAAFSPVLIAKATQGTSFVATTFEAARAGAAKSGLKAFGMYHFWQPGQDPVAQAQHAVATIGKLSNAPVEWLILDVETGDDMGAYHQFCEHADAALGRRTWLYGGQQLTAAQTTRPRWIARYFDQTPNPAHAPGIGEVLWQFADAYAVPGVGTADCSVYRGDVAQFLAVVEH
ncbi:MAG TPA: GH25 family lysozyme [Frankiaceae bacterium]|nr:GH25 family lysozyme [Frankiaceae bacterium]